MTRPIRDHGSHLEEHADRCESHLLSSIDELYALKSYIAVSDPLHAMTRDAATRLELAAMRLALIKCELVMRP